MNKEKFMLYYSFIINTLVLFVLVFGGIIFAESNGVWHRAEDVQGGVFGSDENVINYTFNNDVYFNSYLRNGIYYIDIDEITALNDLRTEKITSNSGEINGDLNVAGNVSVTGNISLDSIKNCNGKLITDSSGNITCGVDSVNDADSDPNNEKPLSGIGITIGVDGRTVNISESFIAKNSNSCNGDINCEMNNGLVGGVLSSGKIQIIDIVTEGTPCSQNGLIAREINGLILSCQTLIWKKLESSWSYAASQCTANGWVYTGGSCQQISSFTSSISSAPASCGPSSNGCYGMCVLPAEHI